MQPPSNHGHRRRGNIRAAILALLAERPMHGYEIMQQLIDRTGGLWRPSPGSIYPNLRRLEDNGLIASQKVENKRLFTLTEAGHSERDRQPSPQPPWEEVTEGLDPVVMRLGQALEELSEAAMHLAQAGTEGQQAKALEVLAGVRHRLYSILAEKA